VWCQVSVQVPADCCVSKGALRCASHHVQLQCGVSWACSRPQCKLCGQGVVHLLTGECAGPNRHVDCVYPAHAPLLGLIVHVMLQFLRPAALGCHTPWTSLQRMWLYPPCQLWCQVMAVLFDLLPVLRCALVVVVFCRADLVTSKHATRCMCWVDWCIAFWSQCGHRRLQTPPLTVAFLATQYHPLRRAAGLALALLVCRLLAILTWCGWWVHRVAAASGLVAFLAILLTYATSSLWRRRRSALTRRLRCCLLRHRSQAHMGRATSAAAPCNLSIGAYIHHTIGGWRSIAPPHTTLLAVLPSDPAWHAVVCCCN
jgi:hypothetical protein